MSARSLTLHMTVLAAATAATVAVWTRDQQTALTHGEVTVWSGRAADVSHVRYEGKTRKVVLLAKQDTAGRYFLGIEERKTPTPEPSADRGAAPVEETTSTFVSVSGAEELSKALAPLRAKRGLGNIPEDRAAEFGFADPEGTLSVVVGGTEHKLVIGAAAPGEKMDRYVRDAATGEAYVMGSVLGEVEEADVLLPERELHEWKQIDAEKAHVVAGDRSRDLVRIGSEGRRSWADPATPEKNDEAIGTWMSKIGSVVPGEHLANAPAGSTLVVRVEYAGASPLGWIDVVKAPGAGGASDYFIRTERIRLCAKLQRSIGEQIEQDLRAVVR